MFQLVLHPLRYPFLNRTIPRPPRDFRAHHMSGEPFDWMPISLTCSGSNP